MSADNKDFQTIASAAAVLYGLFVFVIGALFTIMLLFGKPAAEG